MGFLSKLTTLFSVLLTNILLVNAEENKITAYFFNDSVNGFQFSDAYETHNMGLKFEKLSEFYQIDLGIVTPDMFEYENEYRTANRSFGEFITLVYGRALFSSDILEVDLFSKVSSQGNFGISGLQSLVHQFANFQDDIDLLENVRMPADTWIGVGTDIRFPQRNIANGHYFGLLSYAGTDRLSSQPYIRLNRDVGEWSQFGRLGVEFVLYDKIISAPPVEALAREIRPLISFGFNRNFGPFEIEITENLSLPSIESDNRLYARLFMSASIPIHRLSELFLR